MTISEQKILILPKVKALLESKGFKYTEGFEHIFTKKNECGGVKISLFFSDLGESSNSLFSLSHKTVEDVILEVGVPYNSWSKQKKGLKLLYTIYDNISKYKFTRNSIKIGTPEALELEVVKTSEDVIRWKNALIDYIENDGTGFIDRFSYLPNVAFELNKLDQSENLSYLELLLGRIDHLFRALVIFKLCNDPNFNEKLIRIKQDVMQPEYAEWHPYLEKLERKLELLQPTFNIV